MERPDDKLPDVKTLRSYTSFTDFTSSFEAEVYDLLQSWSAYAEELENKNGDLQDQVNKLESRVQELEDSQ